MMANDRDESGPMSEVIVDGERSRSHYVTFESQNAQTADEVDPRPGNGDRQTAGGALFLPEGEDGNRAAVVVVHGLGGRKPEREMAYGHKLAKAGYVGLVLDSFRARDLDDASESRRALEVSTWSLVYDAFAALRYLADHPRVNPRAIAIIGFSWGGMVTLMSAYEQVRRTYLADRDLGFAGHVAYYGCSVPRLEDPTATGAPVLSMIGKRDRNVSEERMAEICEDLRRGGAEVELAVFDAFHQWDGKDQEKRHMFASLADLHMTLTRDNRMVEERWDHEVNGPIRKALVMLRDLDWEGYDMLRDSDLHRETDRRLFDFLDAMAGRAGALRGDPSRVTFGSIGKPAEG